MRPARNVLLTGAGFTKNFGGYLANEMWASIFNQAPISRDPGLRKFLLGNLDYERAYNEVLESMSFLPTQKDSFTQAIQAAYQELHQKVCASRDSGIKGRARAFCSGFISKFSGENDQRGFVFTLNQDLFIEQFFHHSYSQESIRIPWLSNPNWFSGKLGGIFQKEDWIDLPSRDKVDALAKEFWLNKGDRLMYVKLHGSYGWRSSNGSSVMVIGEEKKGLIKSEPILKWSLELFEEVLRGPQCNLVTIGYGFRDTHINQVISQAIRNHGLQLYVISPLEPSHFEKQLESLDSVAHLGQTDFQAGQMLWEGLHGYYCNSIFDFVDFDPRSTVDGPCRLTALGEGLFEKLKS